MRIIAIATALSVALLAATSLAAPVIESIAPEASPVGTASAAPCVVGVKDICVVPGYDCVQDCDGPPDS